MEQVIVRKCDTYGAQEVKKAVFECIDGLSGMKEKLAGKRVLIKANLLMRKNPEDAVTTHPAVVSALAEYLQGINCRVIIGDSPGGPYTEKALRAIYKAAGMTEVAEKTGCELNYDTGVLEVKHEEAKYLKTMQIIKVIKDVDYVISAAKLKTHGMMTYTGAVKNLFGVIPGLIKAEYHFKMNSTDNFAGHLVDICEYVKPVFSIMDAVEGMEGDGPSSGDKRQVGLIMASANPYALDAAAVRVMGIDGQAVPTIRMAKAMGVFSGDMNYIQVEGVDLGSLGLKPFKLPNSINVNFVGGRLPKFMERAIVNTFRAKPVFYMDKCVGCGDCARSCPPGIIAMQQGKPRVDLNKCISCFCCHELCPKKAVDIKKHWLHEKLFK